MAYYTILYYNILYYIISYYTILESSIHCSGGRPSIALRTSLKMQLFPVWRGGIISYHSMSDSAIVYHSTYAMTYYDILCYNML